MSNIEGIKTIFHLQALRHCPRLVNVRNESARPGWRRSRNDQRREYRHTEPQNPDKHADRPNQGLWRRISLRWDRPIEAVCGQASRELPLSNTNIQCCFKSTTGQHELRKRRPVADASRFRRNGHLPAPVRNERAVSEPPASAPPRRVHSDRTHILRNRSRSSAGTDGRVTPSTRRRCSPPISCLCMQWRSVSGCQIDQAQSAPHLPPSAWAHSRSRTPPVPCLCPLMRQSLCAAAERSRAREAARDVMGEGKYKFVSVTRHAQEMRRNEYALAAGMPTPPHATERGGRRTARPAPCT